MILLKSITLAVALGCCHLATGAGKPAADTLRSAPAPAASVLPAKPGPVGLPQVDYNKLGHLDFDSLPLDHGTTVVARVNGEPVSLSKFQAELKLSLGPRIDSPHADAIKAALATPVLDRVIRETVIHQFARKKGLLPSPAEVQARMDAINRTSPPGHKLEDIAFAADITPDQMREKVAEEATAKKVARLIGDQATTAPPTDQEIADFLKPGRIQTSHTVELRASHIVFRATPDMTTASIEDNRLAAEDVLKKIRNGLDFATAARQYSQDRYTAWKGGDIGYFVTGGMFPAFEKAAFALPVGDVSQVIRTPVGFHIIKVTERHDNNARMLYDQIRRNTAAEEKINDLVRKAKVQKYL